MDPDAMDLQVRLKVRDIAEPRGWTAAKLARRADVSNTAMYLIWDGTTTDPGLKTLIKISKVLKVSITDLYEEVPPRSIIEESIKAPTLVA